MLETVCGFDYVAHKGSIKILLGNRKDSDGTFDGINRKNFLVKSYAWDKQKRVPGKDWGHRAEFAEYAGGREPMKGKCDAAKQSR
ncbi:MAG: hypothetical protein NVS9B4_05900 [Candidatus Acidiferrum sp.]